MATSVLNAITYTQQLVQSDSNAIGSALGLALYNDSLQEWTRDMLNKNIDASGVQEEYRNITTDSPNTYLWPSSMYALKTIEVNWQDTEQQNYIQATPIDVSNTQKRSFSWLRANQSQEHPMFDNRGDWFEIFPTPTTANAQGIRIFHFLRPTEAATVEEAVPYPQILDYRTLSCKMAALYYKTQGDVEMATVYEQEYQQRIAKINRVIEHGSQQPKTPIPLGITGWQY